MREFKSLIYPISVGLVLIPSTVFAHGGAEETQSGLPMSTFGLLAMGLLLILFIAFYMVVKKKVQGLKNVKKKEDRIKRQRLEKNLQLINWGWILSLIGVLITGSLSVMGDKLTVGKGTYLEHIHGLGYSTDGKQVNPMTTKNKAIIQSNLFIPLPPLFLYQVKSRT